MEFLSLCKCWDGPLLSPFQCPETCTYIHDCLHTHHFCCGMVYFYFLLYGLFNNAVSSWRPPLWSSGQSSWLQTQRFQVRFLELLDFLSSSGSGIASTQPRGDK
jgi:hypothetical protein